MGTQSRMTMENAIAEVGVLTNLKNVYCLWWVHQQRRRMKYELVMLRMKYRVFIKLRFFNPPSVSPSKGRDWRS